MQPNKYGKALFLSGSNAISPTYDKKPSLKLQILTSSNEINSNHLRTQSQYFSPNNQTHKIQNQNLKDFKPYYPAFDIDKPKIHSFKNLDEQQKIGSQYNQQQTEKDKFYNIRNRKRSENNIIYENLQYHQNKVQWGNQNQTSKYSYNIAGLSPVANKTRKSSLNVEVLSFGKKKSHNEGTENAEDNDQRKTKLAIKRKFKTWDQDNNFQFGSNPGSSQPNSEPTQGHSKQQFPKPTQIRKHSDNEGTKKQVPSFLTQSKQHRLSMDITDLIEKKFKLTIDNFTIIKQLGKGAFGKVSLVREKQTGAIYAIKIMNKFEIKGDNMVEQLTRELKIQMFVNNPNIIKVYGFFDDTINFYIIMQAALDDHLSTFISRHQSIDQPTIANLFFQMCSAISCLHSERIIHRDLKPDNIMLHQGIVKICDFGWSVYRGSKLRTTFCGTPIYLCPQILIGDEYDESIDVWTLGVIFYELIYHSNPFKITCKEQLINILNNSIYFNQNVIVSDQAKDLICRCLKKRPSDRIDIRQILAHQYFKKIQNNQSFRR